jgi:hypothetical protein
METDGLHLAAANLLGIPTTAAASTAASTSPASAGKALAKGPAQAHLARGLRCSAAVLLLLAVAAAFVLRLSFRTFAITAESRQIEKFHVDLNRYANLPGLGKSQGPTNGMKSPRKLVCVHSQGAGTIDPAQFALPQRLRASHPQEVEAVVQITRYYCDLVRLDGQMQPGGERATLRLIDVETDSALGTTEICSEAGHPLSDAEVANAAAHLCGDDGKLRWSDRVADFADLIIINLLIAVAIALVARYKNRNPWAWGVCSALFGCITWFVIVVWITRPFFKTIYRYTTTWRTTYTTRWRTTYTTRWRTTYTTRYYTRWR